jgi:hypothetical protein
MTNAPRARTFAALAYRCTQSKGGPMDVLEWIMLNAVVLVIAAAIYDFWRGCKGR